MNEDNNNPEYMQEYPQFVDNQSNMNSMTDPTTLILNMELSLRRKSLDLDGEISTNGDSLLNDKGIADVRGIVESVVNRVALFSNLKDEEVYNIGLTTATTLVELLMTNVDEYNINKQNSNTVRSQIMAISMNPINVALTRARGGDDKKFFKNSFQESFMKTERDSKGSWNPFSNNNK